MEKLSLEKFQDAKLDNKQLSFVHAGDSCTGGGTGICKTTSGELVEAPGSGSCTMYLCYSYESDSIDDCGHTSYTGYHKYWSC